MPSKSMMTDCVEVDIAGKVTVVSTDDGLRLGPVDPEDGWSWTHDQPDPTHLVVVMTNGARTFELHAAQNQDGTITAKVTEPIDEAPAPAPAPPTSAASPPATAAPAPSGSSGSTGTVDDHGGERDDAVERAEDEAEHREDEAEDREKEQEDRTEKEDGHDDDD